MDKKPESLLKAVSHEGDDINTLTAGTIITSEQPLEDDNTIRLIQSFYENRRG